VNALIREIEDEITTATNATSGASSADFVRILEGVLGDDERGLKKLRKDLRKKLGIEGEEEDEGEELLFQRMKTRMKVRSFYFRG
jgi:hypothetical protein